MVVQVHLVVVGEPGGGNGNTPPVTPAQGNPGGQWFKQEDHEW